MVSKLPLALYAINNILNAKIKNINKRSELPTKPHSSPKAEKIKSVSYSGKKSKCV